MLDWVGSLRIRERSPLRVVLTLSRSTQIVGWILVFAAGYTVWQAWQVSPWLAMAPGILLGIGGLLVTLRREMVFDREAGVLRLDQSAFGIPSRAVVPLFHLRAVVVVARSAEGDAKPRLMNGARFVAYVERRVGDAIYLDESKRCASLMRMAEAIADVAELRLEYDATGQAS